jgi:hypothetical protein
MLFKAAVQASQRIALSRAGKQYGKIKNLPIIEKIVYITNGDS